MTYITGIFDNCRERREKFVTNIEQNLPSLVFKPLKKYTNGNATILWSAIPDAPVSFFKPELNNKEIFFYFGIQSEKSRIMNAAEIFAKDLELNKSEGKAFNSEYFLGIKLSSNGTIEIVADMLGLFPIYYWVSPSKDIFIFSTSPSAPITHSFYNKKINYRALAGTLLLSHMIDKETIWEDVFRLSAGHKLKWSFGAMVKEEKFNRLIISDQYFDKTEEECIEILNHCFNEIIDKLVKDSPLTFFLSGGLDSRLLAGYLNKHNARIKTVYMFGEKLDDEVICARNVVRELKWDFLIISSELENILEYAINQIKLEQGTCSFLFMDWWKGINPLLKNRVPHISGFIGDAAMGGNHISWGYNEESNTYSFETLFKKINTWGLTPETIKSVFKISENKHAVEEAIDSLKTTYDSYDGNEFQKVWLFDLLHRQRFHIAPFAFRFSFGSWPRLPYANPKILSILAGFPERIILRRAVQVKLLKSYFPKLAKLPFEGNYDLIPKIKKHWLKNKIKRRLKRHKLFLYRKERNYYRRVFDINNSEWSEIRGFFEKNRNKLDILFYSKQVNKLIPSSTQKMNVKNKIIGTAGIKTLMMIIILLNQYPVDSGVSGYLSDGKILQ